MASAPALDLTPSLRGDLFNTWHMHGTDAFFFEVKFARHPRSIQINIPVIFFPMLYPQTSLPCRAQAIRKALVGGGTVTLRTQGEVIK